MFKITSTHALNFPSVQFKIAKGENVFASEKKIPDAAWSRLERMREAKILSFERTGKDDDAKLEELSEANLYDMSKEELTQLAARSGVTVDAGASKKMLLDALMTKKSGAAPGNDESDGVEFTEASLGQLSYKQLVELAAEAAVDVDGLKSKQQIIEKLLAEAAEGTQA